MEKYKAVHKAWQELLGNKNVILVKDPLRLVDTILGLLAFHVNEIVLFKERFELRQTPEQVKEVYSTLKGML